MGSKTKKYSLSVFVLAMMNVAVVLNLRGLPMMAKEGLLLMFYLLFSGILFLIPTALVSAELATGWSEGGGVYRWVKEAFGDHAGFTAIFLQWIQNVIWYPTVLAFGAGALAYFFLDPTLAQNKLFNIIIILVVYWGSTFINFHGIKASGRLSSWGVVYGTFLPGTLVIILGSVWWAMGKPIVFMENVRFIPNFSDFSQVAFLAGIILLFSGMEVSAVHAKDVRNPRRDYPKAIFFATILILVVFTFGSLSVAAVIPTEEITLTAGIMQGFDNLLEVFHLHWLLPIIGLLIAFGTIGNVAAWIVGPSKGLFATAKEGNLPPFLARANKAGVPTNILMIQGIIVTLLSLVYLWMPTISSAFFLLTALTVILYLIMYILLFAAAIRLRYSQPNVKRSYRIPGGNFGMWIVAGVGILASLFAISVGFFPPAQLKITSPRFYVLFLICGVIVFLAIPLFIVELRKSEWRRRLLRKKGG